MAAGQLYRLVVAGVGVVAGLTATAQAVKFDPIENMCVRYDHQSSVKNNVLYIDGGMQTYVPIVNGSQQTGNITVGYNNVLIKIDLSKSWDWKKNISEKAINKTGIANVLSTPVLSRGALYEGATSDNNIYLYGGTTSYSNTSDPAWEPPTSSQYSLWSYDTVSKSVAQYNISGESPYRPSSGAYAQAADQGLAFYLNGEVDSGSSIETQELGDSKKFFLDGMMVINTTERTARNLSTAAVADGQPRTYGSLQYVPGVGQNGILVHFGGSDQNGNLLPLDSADVFNVHSLYNDSGTWAKQAIGGDIPIARVSACVVMASAQDSSSHNIYLYGGRGSGNQYFDQIYVLSIPSFTWTKIYEGSSPRFAHTCHLVGNRQMLTVGGITNNPLTNGPCDYQTKGVNIFDLSTLTWTSIYNANAPPYTVPAPLVAKIGGSPTGGSNATYPTSILQLLSNARTPRPASSQTSAGVIAGAAVGAVAGVAIICGGLWFLYLHHRRHRNEEEIPPSPVEKDGASGIVSELSNDRRWEMPGWGSGVEMDAERGPVTGHKPDQKPPVELR